MPARASRAPNWFRRHPRLALLAVNAALLVGAALVLEAVLRLSISYNPGYYVSVGGTDRKVEYPYGTILINRHGYPDSEFELEREQRVGYFGDSVTYGVGAGYGHRFTEILEEAYPGYEHMNFGGIGLTLSQREIRNIEKIVGKFELTHVVYAFNLNDIVPDEVSTATEETTFARIRGYVSRYLDWMRGESYLYTWLRTKVKTLVEARGTGFHGYEAFELFPERNERIFEETAARINRLGEGLRERGVELTVVILPYEMQISAEAAEVYRGHGVSWEAGFLEGSPQRIMAAHLADGIRVIDARHGFLGGDARSFGSNAVGEYFVYDRGDKLDWNHPNRAGHRVIARYLIDRELLEPRRSSSARAAPPPRE